MDEVKFVIADLNDWEFAKETIAKHNLVNRTKEVLISPIHGIENLPEIAEKLGAVVRHKRQKEGPARGARSTVVGQIGTPREELSPPQRSLLSGSGGRSPPYDSSP